MNESNKPIKLTNFLSPDILDLLTKYFRAYEFNWFFHPYDDINAYRSQLILYNETRLVDLEYKSYNDLIDAVLSGSPKMVELFIKTTNEDWIRCVRTVGMTGYTYLLPTFTVEYSNVNLEIERGFFTIPNIIQTKRIDRIAEHLILGKYLIGWRTEMIYSHLSLLKLFRKHFGHVGHNIPVILSNKSQINEIIQFIYLDPEGLLIPINPFYLTGVYSNTNISDEIVELLIVNSLERPRSCAYVTGTLEKIESRKKLLKRYNIRISELEEVD